MARKEPAKDKAERELKKHRFWCRRCQQGLICDAERSFKRRVVMAGGETNPPMPLNF